MVVFVTGVGGQLGYDVMKELEKRGHIAVGSDVQERSAIFKNYIKLDFTDKNAVFDVLKQVKPDVVIHCGAWTAVDDAEDEQNREKVKKINENGTENIAIACKELACKMIYISTDYVFDGKGDKPWQPDCKNFSP